MDKPPYRYDGSHYRFPGEARRTRGTTRTRHESQFYRFIGEAIGESRETPWWKTNIVSYVRNTYEKIRYKIYGERFEDWEKPVLR